MTLLELFEAVKDGSLSKTDLEHYHGDLTNLYAAMQVEVADLEKEEAKFFYARTQPSVSDISIKREWKATDQGQRLILLNRYIKATSKILSSLKSRLYNLY